MERRQWLWLPWMAIGLAVALPARGDELKPEHVLNVKGDGPDGKGNTADDTWGFWFELAHEPARFERLSLATAAMTEAQRKDGIRKKVRGPVASLLPNPADSEGWIFHRDWDGRFEGVWADKKTNAVLAYPYVEKQFHGAVAITYRAHKAGVYDLAGKLTDLTVNDQAPHDGILWRVELLTGKEKAKVLDKGGPVGDGKGPESASFQVRQVKLSQGDIVRLVIHPNRWWGTDLTRVDYFRIEATKE